MQVPKSAHKVLGVAICPPYRSDDLLLIKVLNSKLTHKQPQTIGVLVPHNPTLLPSERNFMVDLNFKITVFEEETKACRMFCTTIFILSNRRQSFVTANRQNKKVNKSSRSTSC